MPKPKQPKPDAAPDAAPERKDKAQDKCVAADLGHHACQCPVCEDLRSRG